MTPAPADAQHHRGWPLWQKILAYGVFALLAAVSIWLVDRDASVVTPTPGATATSR